MKNNRPPYAEQKQGGALGGRKVLLGVTGGIAAYKAVELARLLMRAGAKVQVVMSDSATKFVTPLTFETVTARHVYVEMFPPHGDISPWHTELATWPDVAVIAPATANCLAKLSHGIADDLLSTLMLTLERRRILCPAMNPRMWANPATQENLATLKRRGYRVIPPEEGQMARPGEDEGVGRLAEPEIIFREISHLLSAPQDLRGVRVLVTGGRTEESWDPVRVLTNRASGRMGFALAEEARDRGAEVMLIHGPTDVTPPTGVRIRRVTTASEMAAAVRQEFSHCNILLMSAAVADYTFADTADHKIKKGLPQPEMKLVATEDILRSLASQKGNRVIVGFALETENLLENALRKLREKHLDIVVANNPLERGSGFSVDTNQVLIIHRGGRVQDLPLQSKREVAREILNAVYHTYRNPEPDVELESQEEQTDEGLFSDEDLANLPDLPASVAADNASSFASSNQSADSRRDARSRRRRGRKRHDRDLAAYATPTTEPATTATPMPPAERTASPATHGIADARSSTVEPVAVSNGKHEAIGEVISAAPSDKKRGRGRRGGRRQRERAARAAAKLGADAVVASPTPSPRPVEKPVVLSAPAEKSSPQSLPEKPVAVAVPAKRGRPKLAKEPKAAPVKAEKKPAVAKAKSPAGKKTAKPKPKKNTLTEA